MCTVSKLNEQFVKYVEQYFFCAKKVSFYTGSGQVVIGHFIIVGYLVRGGVG
jgi:hypothetical protein